MKQLLYFSLITFFLSSCTSNTIYKKPKDLISQEQMVDLLVDMHLAVGGKPVKNIDGKRSNYMPLIYQKYDIDSARFARSNFYYSTKIDDYKNILEAVKVRLDTLKSINELLLKESDSIKKEVDYVNKRGVKKQLKLLDSLVQ